MSIPLGGGFTLSQCLKFQRRAALIRQLVASFLPFVARVIRPEVEKLAVAATPTLDPGDVRALARMAGALAAEAGGGFAEVRRAMRGIRDLARLESPAPNAEEIDRRTAVIATEEARDLILAWIAALEATAASPDGARVIDALTLDGSMLPRETGDRPGFATQLERHGGLIVDETTARGILWDVHSALPSGRVLPDCAADLLAYDGFVVVHY